MRAWRMTLLILTVLGSAAIFGCGHASKNAAQGGGSSVQPVDNSAQSAQSAGQPAQSPAASANGPSQPATAQVTIPDGTPIAVRLQESLGSARSERGETFHATLAAPLEVNGAEVVPSGANVTGRVLLARPSGHFKTPAELSVTITSFELNGQRYSIVTSHRSWRGRSHKKHNLKWIAGGSGAGALIGAVVGHGVGAAIGAGVGAGGGTAAAYATGKKNIVLPSETRLRFILREPVTVTESQPS
ncbi:MAG TPA: hypothetical protein VL523_10140 [Terriglobia bacterium]|nr:hypothetical protein [Terriglobia bacterium]